MSTMVLNTPGNFIFLVSAILTIVGTFMVSTPVVMIIGGILGLLVAFADRNLSHERDRTWSAYARRLLRYARRLRRPHWILPISVTVSQATIFYERSRAKVFGHRHPRIVLPPPGVRSLNQKQLQPCGVEKCQYQYSEYGHYLLHLITTHSQADYEACVDTSTGQDGDYSYDAMHMLAKTPRRSRQWLRDNCPPKPHPVNIHDGW
ncbi:hypothetical protein EXIGLDRAFT_692818 [Exidia glandulosa HHB12029]|uniref:Uncharacterized protein n=1 Tax=Exidia glandulosa HHB12029 TaxID=1314781 RepID=A0A165NWD1_EXIGL|nr:hypothetical protein EXIGLDRAFT_692818 [Exidia glandulosa HHB12029]